MHLGKEDVEDAQRNPFTSVEWHGHTQRIQRQRERRGVPAGMPGKSPRLVKRAPARGSSRGRLLLLFKGVLSRRGGAGLPHGACGAGKHRGEDDNVSAPLHAQIPEAPRAQ
jgi:hypothetical protein